MSDFEKNKRLAELMKIEDFRAVKPYVWANVHTQYNPFRNAEQLQSIIDKYKPAMVHDGEVWFVNDSENNLEAVSDARLPTAVCKWVVLNK